MTIKEMKERKKELGYTYAQLSERSGVPLGTLQKIFNGTTAAPRYDTLQALEKVLGDKGKENGYSAADLCGTDTGILMEAQPEYGAKKRQGEFTLEDYYEIPDDIRVELIDGVLYTMNSPTSGHQMIGGLIYTKLMNYVMQKKGKCLPMISPIDVQLDCDEKTMVQPDVVIVCDRNKVIMRCVYGAPDFVVEVLSKSTKKKDSVVKLHKYMNAGVKEYWIIDPVRKVVIVYHFESDVYPVMYGFDTKIPVGIWGEDCVIDFNEIYEYVQFLYEDETM